MVNRILGVNTTTDQKHTKEMEEFTIFELQTRALQILVSIFYYGNFKIETPAERDLIKILEFLNMWPTTDYQIINWLKDKDVESPIAIRRQRDDAIKFYSDLIAENAGLKNSRDELIESLEIASYKIAEMLHHGVFEENEVVNFKNAQIKINDVLTKTKGDV